MERQPELAQRNGVALSTAWISLEPFVLRANWNWEDAKYHCCFCRFIV